jgi:hypothetical protein
MMNLCEDTPVVQYYIRVIKNQTYERSGIIRIFTRFG